MPRKPSQKHIETVKHLASDPTATLSEAMRAADYSENTIDHPGQNFIGLPGAQAAAEQFGVVLERYVSNERIANKISTLMDAKTYTRDGKKVDDGTTQLKATELAIRARNLLGSDEPKTPVNHFTQINVNKYAK